MNKGSEYAVGLGLIGICFGKVRAWPTERGATAGA